MDQDDPSAGAGGHRFERCEQAEVDSILRRARAIGIDPARVALALGLDPHRFAAATEQTTQDGRPD